MDIMRYPKLIIVASILSMALAPAAVNGEAALGRAADNKIHGQELINEIVRSNPDLIIASMHAVAPGSKSQTMIASTMDRIGEKDDDEDLTVVSEQETVLARSLKEPAKFKTHLPMKDASGDVIGLIVLIFKTEPGYDETHYCARAIAIRDGVAKQIKDLQSLFDPAQ